jgi:hypothetical protein
MIRYTLRGLLSLALALLALASCGPTESEEAVTIQTDRDALAELIVIPAEPLELFWVRERSDGNPLQLGPNYRVTAVFRYDDATLAGLQEQLAWQVKSNITITAAHREPWFPAELNALLEAAEGQQISDYRPDLFSKPPYSHMGSLYLLGNYLVLSISDESW